MQRNIMAAAARIAMAGAAEVFPSPMEDNATGPGTKKTVGGRFVRRDPDQFTSSKKKSDSLKRLLRK